MTTVLLLLCNCESDSDHCAAVSVQVKVPEEGDEEGGGDGPTRWRYFQVKIKWASSVNITDIQQYLKCVVGHERRLVELSDFMDAI